MKRIRLYYNTIKYLKARQLLYRLYYLARNKVPLYKDVYKEIRSGAKLRPVKLKPWIPRAQSYTEPDSFHFLNLEKTFKREINWNYDDFGKLWTYNLNYFDFLNQPRLSPETGLRLIKHFIESEPYLLDGKEPYPTSLRLINWLKFIYRHEINDNEINSFMLHDLYNLSHNVEYHIMGNHLLENAIALVIGGYCLNEQVIYEKGFWILNKELQEQLCDDGGHYEKSPMYHQILLERLLDCINFTKEKQLLIPACKAMLSWLDVITLSDGSIPLFNDSSYGVTSTTSQIKKYASELGISESQRKLGSSGYRKLTSDHFELIIDGGNIGPPYQPGHGHNDAGSFVLYIDKKPLFIDTGTSTYETGHRRMYERSVEAHNTSHPVGIEPSELWGSFRVGQREKVEIIKESGNSVEIRRQLPSKERHIITRSIQCDNTVLKIHDKAVCSDNYRAYLHLSPQLNVIETHFGLRTPIADIHINDAMKYKLEKCQISGGFNKLLETKKVIIDFIKDVEILIKARNPK